MQSSLRLFLVALALFSFAPVRAHAAPRASGSSSASPTTGTSVRVDTEAPPSATRTSATGAATSSTPTSSSAAATSSDAAARGAASTTEGTASGPSRSPRDPHEEPNRNYWFLGASFHESFMPAGIVELFAEHAPRGLRIPRLQLELTRRRNNSEIITSLYWADYAFTGPFLAKDEPITKFEMIHSTAQAFGAAVTFLWSKPFNDIVAFEGGFAVGFGGMVGTVTRTEAYPSQGGPNTRDGYAACAAPTSAGQPGSAQPTDPFDPAASGGAGLTTFCGTPNSRTPRADGTYSDGDVKNGEQYGVQARSMLHGGHTPFFSARLAPQISLRIKPIDHFAMRIDFGFDFFSGIFLGAGAAYGF